MLPKSSKSRYANLLVPIQIEQKSQYGFVPPDIEVSKERFFFFDGYCSTVQGLLDWFEVDLGLTKLSFIQIDLYRQILRWVTSDIYLL